MPAGADVIDDKVDLVSGGGGEAWVHGFVSSLSMILVSEIGDKTFFIAAVMAMRKSRIVVYAGAMSALALMTSLSVAMGLSLQAVPVLYTWMASICLFLAFGAKMMREAYGMADNEGMEELEEVVQEIEENENTVPGAASNGAVGLITRFGWIFRTFVGAVFAQAFTMTFLAEWGDRSQIATIALGASTNPYAVTLGGIIGHGLCTLAAVIGGRILAQRISVRHDIDTTTSIIYETNQMSCLVDCIGDSDDGRRRRFRTLCFTLVSLPTGWRFAGYHPARRGFHELKKPSKMLD